MEREETVRSPGALTLKCWLAQVRSQWNTVTGFQSLRGVPVSWCAQLAVRSLPKAPSLMSELRAGSCGARDAAQKGMR